MVIFLYSFNVMNSNIVSVVLCGGLCNRLFQIACCYGYAEKYNYLPIIYTKFSDSNAHSTQDATLDMLKALVLDITISNDDVNNNDFIIVEIDGNFPSKYFELPSHNGKNVLLKGYFQSEKYFPAIDKFLLPFVNKLNTPSYEHCYEHCYFIHVRLGDYVNNYMHNLHILGHKNYFKKAIEHIISKDNDATFLICSNERNKDAILRELDYNNQSRLKFEIDNNQQLDPLTTLTQMALCCGGGICVNSSFSWIGAYLSRLNDTTYTQIFTMPSIWFNEKYISKDNYKDIYPEWQELTIITQD